MQSGRPPAHVHAKNSPEAVGMPAEMTGLAEVMSKAAYATGFVGKWDLGSHAPSQFPLARGYDSFYGYMQHGPDYWTYRNTFGAHCFDLVRDNAFAAGDINSQDGSCAYSKENGPRNSSESCAYIEDRFEDEVTRILDEHPASGQPLFLFWAMHSVHTPVQPPDSAMLAVDRMDPTAKCSSPGSTIRDHQAMIFDMDARVGRVVHKVKSLSMWDRTLVIFSSDNGGAEAANNGPLAGQKRTPWEGGIRVCAFASGGFLPPVAQGTRQGGLIAVWDWYATFAALAGVDDPYDERAAAAQLPDVLSYNVWPLLSGSTAQSPRESLLIAGTEDLSDDANPVLFGIIRPPWKLLVGSSKMHRKLPLWPTVWTCSTGECPPSADTLAAEMLHIDLDTAVRWVGHGEGEGTVDVVGTLRRDRVLVDGKNAGAHRGGHRFASDQPAIDCLAESERVCDEVPEKGCLFNIWNDPSESASVAEANPEVFNRLLVEFKKESQHVFRQATLDDSTDPLDGVPTDVQGKLDCWQGPRMTDTELADAVRGSHNVTKG